MVCFSSGAACVVAPDVFLCYIACFRFFFPRYCKRVLLWGLGRRIGCFSEYVIDNLSVCPVNP